MNALTMMQPWGHLVSVTTTISPHVGHLHDTIQPYFLAKTLTSVRLNLFCETPGLKSHDPNLHGCLTNLVGTTWSNDQLVHVVLSNLSESPVISSDSYSRDGSCRNLALRGMLLRKLQFCPCHGDHAGNFEIRISRGFSVPHIIKVLPLHTKRKNERKLRSWTRILLRADRRVMDFIGATLWIIP